MLAALEHHLESLGAEPDHEVLAVSDHGHPDATGQGTPLPQLVNVLADVGLFELAAMFL